MAHQFSKLITSVTSSSTSYSHFFPPSLNTTSRIYFQYLLKSAELTFPRKTFYRNTLKVVTVKFDPGKVGFCACLLMMVYCSIL